MLVLSRKIQEQVRIGDNITLTILQVKGKTVRVGIEAPRDVRVVRGELPAKENQQAPAEEESEAKETEEVQSQIITGRFELPRQPAGGTNRLRELVLKVSSTPESTTSAV